LWTEPNSLLAVDVSVGGGGGVVRTTAAYMQPVDGAQLAAGSGGEPRAAWLQLQLQARRVLVDGRDACWGQLGVCSPWTASKVSSDIGFDSCYRPPFWMNIRCHGRSVRYLQVRTASVYGALLAAGACTVLQLGAGTSLLRMQHWFSGPPRAVSQQPN
jgi:hypothetical protein